MKEEKEIFYAMILGDDHALKVLLHDYHNYLMVVGLRYLNDRQRVEDVIHDLFSDLWNSKKEIVIQSSVKSFLRGSLINKCLAILRKEKRIDLVDNHNEALIESAPSIIDNMSAENLKLAIDNIVNKLPEKCRKVFEYSRYHQKSYAEISVIMGISKKTIESHMTKALKALRNGLKRQELIVIVFIFIKLSLTLRALSFLGNTLVQ